MESRLIYVFNPSELLFLLMLSQVDSVCYKYPTNVYLRYKYANKCFIKNI